MKVTSDLEPLKVFYYAEDYHQQYLDKNPNGYCGLRGSGYELPDWKWIFGMGSNNDNKKDNDDQKEGL